MKCRETERCSLRTIVRERLAAARDEGGGESQFITVKRGEKLRITDGNKALVFGVCSGVLGRQNLLTDGRRSIVELFMKGDLILDQIKPRNSEIVALSESKLLVFDAAQLNLLRRSSDAVDCVVQDCLTNQSCILAEHCADIAKKTPPERVASFLFEYAGRSSGDDQPDDKIAIDMKGRDIGEYLALETETVSRSYAKLIENGVVSVAKPGQINILNEEKLREIADGGMPRKRKSTPTVE